MIQSNNEWTAWELEMQMSVANLVPPLPIIGPVESVDRVRSVDASSYSLRASKDPQQLHGTNNGKGRGNGGNRMKDPTFTTATAFSNMDHLKMFPHLLQQALNNNHDLGQAAIDNGIIQSANDGNENMDSSKGTSFATAGKSANDAILFASDSIVPIPNYKLMGEVRSKLERNLRQHARTSCKETQSRLTRRISGFGDENQQQKQQQSNAENDGNNGEHHALPVMGITVAHDTPTDRYLRRLLYTTDLSAVGSIVITWYDEQTEAQLVGKEQVGLSHVIIEQALVEFIEKRGFVEIDWESTTTDEDATLQHRVQLASRKSLNLMSQIASSIHQYCIFDNDIATTTNNNYNMMDQNNTHPHLLSNNNCQNELLILRFPTNLGCSPGVNNPLFTHPTSPHWLIVNYDIAYPPGVLTTMGKELEKTRQQKPDLAVHTYGYIYGRGKLQNPWSNFVMTSCAVANVGVWDENIFPAYYEDDDFRDRIRYIMGKWEDSAAPGFHGGAGRGNILKKAISYFYAPQKLMNDGHLIHYQTDRNVSVAHGPLSANGYISGTASIMKKWDGRGFLKSLSSLFGLFPNNVQSTSSFTTTNSYVYESRRYGIIQKLANTEGYFRRKHGGLPDPGFLGHDSLRYFGWDERFVLPFENKKRMKGDYRREDNEGLDDNEDHFSNTSPWSRWYFNDARRRCTHVGANALLSISSWKEEEKLLATFKEECTAHLDSTPDSSHQMDTIDYPHKAL